MQAADKAAADKLAKSNEQAQQAVLNNDPAALAKLGAQKNE